MKKNKDNNLLRKDKKDLKKANYQWIIKITIIAFVISFCFSFISEKTLPSVNMYLGVFLVLFFIFLGVLFDIIGVAVTSADEAPFHSMNSRKVRGAKIAVSLIKNASKVASFCNDVIGDICGIISGSAGVIIANAISINYNLNNFYITLIITALIASLTIGGKAVGKTFAINKSNFIIYNFSKFLYVFSFKK